MRKLLLAAGLCVGGAAWAGDEAATAQAETEGAAVEIAKGVLCTAVADREAADPRESGAEYEASVERVYFWNAANVARPPAVVKHVWSRDGKAMAEVMLELKHARTRTWSSKKVGPGSWKVEAVSPEGIVLAVAEFTVK